MSKADKKAASEKAKAQSKKSKKQESSSEDDEEEEEDQEVPWWENPDASKAFARGEKRWTTLTHNGVMFPPPYEPHGIPIKYEGKPFELKPAEEEVATMYAISRENPAYTNPVFRKNFFEAFRDVMKRTRGGDCPIKKLEYMTFDEIWAWHQEQREKKKNKTAAQKKLERAEKEAEAAPYKYCVLDGKKEECANYRIEPPGLFRGRGKHPKLGCLKKRIVPEDITINIGEGEEVPKCPPGHKWKRVVHDATVSWLAYWQDTVTGSFKYVRLGGASSINGRNDREKYERAKRLKAKIKSIRDSYQADYASKDAATQQRAVTMYFIDKLALRVGNEKGEDEADTVGCCSLRVEHVMPVNDDDCTLHFEFLGKDSVPYVSDVQVDRAVYDLVKSFRQGKRKGDQLFDMVTPTDLNKHLKEFMTDLSAKVFRTYNASQCLQEQFEQTPCNPKLSLHDKMAYFNEANTKVAILCNHQKQVGKAHDKQIFELNEKAENVKRLIALIEDCRDIENKKGKGGGSDKAREHFDEGVEKMQRDWLNEYGTEEEKKSYEEFLAERGNPKPRKSSQSTGTKRARASSPADSDDMPFSQLVKKKAGRKTVKKEESSSDEDETLADLAKKAGKRGASPAKKRAKKEEKVKKEESSSSSEEEDSSSEDEDSSSSSSSSSEDEKPISKLKLRGKKAGGKKSPSPKKGRGSGKKSPSPSPSRSRSPSPKKAGGKKSSPKGAKKKASPSRSPSPKKGKASPKKASPKKASPKKASPKKAGGKKGKK